jgi:small-conductance mechanosensitive channel
MPELPEWISEYLKRWDVRQWDWSQLDLDRWIAALVIAAAALVLLQVVNSLVGRRARRLAEADRFRWAELVADLADRTKFPFLLIEALFLGSLVLLLPDRARSILNAVAIITLIVQAAIWGSATVTYLVTRYAKHRMEADPTSVTTISAVGVLGRIVIYSVAVLLVLDNLGVDITAMVAGLGIGGVAVALAAQNILGDLFASASIVLDKPFVLGDFIIVGSEMGSVERIGLKTTRVRSLSGEQLVFANNDLLQSRIRNYKRMLERRVVFSLGVIYGTPHEKVAAIPEMIREAVEAQEQVRFDRAHFKQFGHSSLDFEIVYYVLSADYNLYMDIQQAINLLIYQRFEKEGLEFAFPTQTIHLESLQYADDPKKAA